jgi:sugar phosphate isomerase/epimerase
MFGTSRPSERVHVRHSARAGPGRRRGDRVALHRHRQQPGAALRRDGYRRAAEDFNRFGEAARARGLRFYQHNHSGEFAVENGTRLYDVILEETDPRLVFFELDIFWAYVGQSRFPGFKPHEYPWEQPKRFPLFHVKDGLFNGGPSFGWTMTDVGDGDIPFEPFFCGLDRGDHHYIVERDTAPDPVANPAGSYATTERSYAYLADLRARCG